MPFKSKAQLRKFGAMVKRGEISKRKFNEWLKATPSVKKLPERVKKKSKLIKKIILRKYKKKKVR